VTVIQVGDENYVVGDGVRRGSTLAGEITVVGGRWERDMTFYQIFIAKANRNFRKFIIVQLNSFMFHANKT